jgi:hypothetical protein
MGKARNNQTNLPSPHNWETTDDDEISRSRHRAQTEFLRLRDLDARELVRLKVREILDRWKDG